MVTRSLPEPKPASRLLRFGVPLRLILGRIDEMARSACAWAIPTWERARPRAGLASRARRKAVVRVSGIAGDAGDTGAAGIAWGAGTAGGPPWARAEGP